MKANNTDKLQTLKKLLSAEKSYSGSSVFITSNKELALFKCTGLVEYTEERVKLRTVDTTLTVYGKKLELKSFSTSEICVTGQINKVEFEGGE